MLYAALGDSITFGQEASVPEKAYRKRILHALQSRGVKVRDLLLAQPGWTSGDLLAALARRQYEPVRHADIVTIWIGGMDLLLQELPNYESNLAALLGGIRNANPGARIVCCTQYNPFPESGTAAAGIRELNRIVSGTARSHGALTAPCFKWFEGRQKELIYGYRSGRLEDILTEPRPIHPNDRGHDAIARGLLPYFTTSR